MEEILAQVERILRIVLIVLVTYLIALWMASVLWTLRDIRSRTNDLLLQVAATLLVTIFSFPGLLLYVILRPPKTLSELYEESLEEEAFLQSIQVQSACPVCKQKSEPDFVFCPWCQTRLKRLCPSCERPLIMRWKVCPYCGEQMAPPVPVPGPELAGTGKLQEPAGADS